MVYAKQNKWDDIVFSGEVPKDDTINLQPCIWCSAQEEKLSCLHSQMNGAKKEQDKNLFSIRCTQCGAHSPLCESVKKAVSVWNSTTFNTGQNKKGKLTTRKIKNLKPKDKLYRITDSNGLCLEIRPAGSKLWRFRYRFDDKDKMISLGSFPEISLAEARLIRDEQKEILNKNLDPSRIRQTKRLTTKENNEEAQIVTKIDTLIRQLRKSKKQFIITT